MIYKFNKYIGVPINFYYYVFTEAIFISDAMKPEYVCKLETLLGRKNWSNLNNYQRILAGMCMADMVRRKLVPYAFTNEHKKSTKQYCSDNHYITIRSKADLIEILDNKLMPLEYSR